MGKTAEKKAKTKMKTKNPKSKITFQEPNKLHIVIEFVLRNCSPTNTIVNKREREGDRGSEKERERDREG